MTRMLLALLLLVATPAAAQTANFRDQLSYAADVFTAGASESLDYIANGHAKLLGGLDGRWTSVGVLLEGFTSEIFGRACEILPVDIAVRDAYTVDFVHGYGEGQSYTTTYASRGGNAFGSYTDTAALLRRFALDADTAAPGTIANVLANANGIATMARPSPDILVVQTNYSMPVIYGRCPSS